MVLLPARMAKVQRSEHGLRRTTPLPQASGRSRSISPAVLRCQSPTVRIQVPSCLRTGTGYQLPPVSTHARTSTRTRVHTRERTRTHAHTRPRSHTRTPAHTRTHPPQKTTTRQTTETGRQRPKIPAKSRKIGPLHDRNRPQNHRNPRQPAINSSHTPKIPVATTIRPTTIHHTAPLKFAPLRPLANQKTPKSGQFGHKLEHKIFVPRPPATTRNPQINAESTPAENWTGKSGGGQPLCAGFTFLLGAVCRQSVCVVSSLRFIC